MAELLGLSSQQVFSLPKEVQVICRLFPCCCTSLVGGKIEFKPVFGFVCLFNPEFPGRMPVPTEPGSSSAEGDEQEHPAQTMELTEEKANEPKNHPQGCQDQGKSITKRCNN